MVGSFEEVIEEIKSAGNESELMSAIDHFLSRVRERNNLYSEAGNILNMIISLRVAAVENLSEQALKNVRVALEVLRQYREQSPRSLF